MALTCTPGWASAWTISCVSTVAFVLSAVQVVMTSAPVTASAALLASCTSKPRARALRASFASAPGSVSHARRRVMPSAARMPRAWNSDCEPVPRRASVRESGRASSRAARPDVAAVRSAVSSVISARNVG
ncbi:hypothetical protein ISCU110981_19845 [Isoptericola cucumis]